MQIAEQISKNLEYFYINEKAAHGSVLPPFVKYQLRAETMFPFAPIHWHEEVEIIKVTKGKCLVCVEGKWLEGSEGDIFFLRPFVMHSVNKVTDDTVLSCLMVNLRLLGNDESSIKFFAPVLNTKHYLPCAIETFDECYAEFNSYITQIFEGDDAAETKTSLYNVFRMIYDNRLSSAMVNLSEDKHCYTVKLALEYIRTEYMNNITIEQIANHCGYSDFYMMKLFKQFTRCSCVDYINNYRLTVAGQQLLQTTDDIAEIAYQVGYNNVSYFNRQFKKLYMQTPKEFRHKAQV